MEAGNELRLWPRGTGTAGQLPRHNLPANLGTLIGREAEVAALLEHLAGTRLLTLTGAGGCGKTRLALEVALRTADRFRDGVWLVELGALADPELVPHQVASVLGISERPGRPPAGTIVEALRSEELLVLLDNCEHLVDACARLADLVLSTCANVRILATSREALNVGGEVTWWVPSLQVPDAQATLSLEEVARHSAVELFLERARAAQPRFELTADDAPYLVRICRELDGLPLAIELAAARVSLVPPRQLTERLEDRFRILTAGRRTALPRQQTLRAAVTWSHDLLSPEEQRLFRRLSVFAGAFDIDAAESICAGEDTPPEDVLQLVGQLLDKSLLSVGDQPGRYRMLETLRWFGAGHLLEAGEDQVGRRRHAAYYGELAERAAERRAREGHAPWLQRLDAEHDNLRAALAWSVAQEPARALELATALGWFWDLRGHLAEGRSWLDQALRSAGPAPSVQALRARNLLGWLALRQGDLDDADSAFTDCLRALQESGDRALESEVQTCLGQLAYARGDRAGAQSAIEKALAAASELRDEPRVANALFQLGLLAYFGGDREAAAEHVRHSLEIRRRQGDRVGTAFALGLLSSLAIDTADLDAARRLLMEAMGIIRELGDRANVGYGLDVLARLAVVERRYDRALRLAGAARSLRSAIGTASISLWQELVDRDLDLARRILGTEAAAEEWARGAAMTWEEALVLGLAAPDPAAPGPPGEGSAPLSRRETEIAELVARGLSNPEIAEHLFIARRTAEAHVQHILDKLGLSSRVEIAAWVIERRFRTDGEP